MKIIHTADWHLGQRFSEFDRLEEHNYFLAFLLYHLKQTRPDVIIVAGDIFDIGNPPNYALKQYYEFLRKAANICPNIIITGGNHDSIATLNAPQSLLKAFNINVIGGACERIRDEIIEVKNKEGKLIGVVGAVPFLRDRDIRKAVAGEAYMERVQRIKEGIKRHYELLRDEMLPYKEQGIPLIATGHLFAAGSTTSDSEKDIHIGNQAKVTAETFPIEFDYIALGHIHKPQLVNGLEHIRYSGSPIPLSFSERDDKKQILLVEFDDNGKLAEIKPIKVRTYRPLIRYKGRFEQLKKQLLAFEESHDDPTVWAEVIVEVEEYEPDINEKIKQLVEGKNIKILKTRILYLNQKRLDEQVESQINLDDLEPIDVFFKKCESQQMKPEAQTELTNTFKELLDFMAEKED